MNDRALRNIVVGLGGKSQGVPREDGFDITVASEIMAILCLSKDIIDLKNRLAKIIIGYTRKNEPVTAGDLNAQGAMAALLKDAIKPNLVQTLEHTPAFVHGGPFANIAHGCNSIAATTTALKLADYVVTEAGFGADLGAEKFIDIKCRFAGIQPDAVVIVATVKALKLHGAQRMSWARKTWRLWKDCPTCSSTLKTLQIFKLPAVVAINRFVNDTDAELKMMRCLQEGKRKICLLVWARGEAAKPLQRMF